jgi:hypothetical protein
VNLDQDKDARNWRQVIWRAWRGEEDEAIAAQLYRLVARQPAGREAVLILVALTLLLYVVLGSRLTWQRLRARLSPMIAPAQPLLLLLLEDDIFRGGMLGGIFGGPLGGAFYAAMKWADGKYPSTTWVRAAGVGALGGLLGGLIMLSILVLAAPGPILSILGLLAVTLGQAVGLVLGLDLGLVGGLLFGLLAQLPARSLLDLSLMRDGMVEWVREGEAWAGLGTPRPEFKAHLWDPLQDVVRPVRAGERVGYFGFRLVHRV